MCDRAAIPIAPEAPQLVFLGTGQCEIGLTKRARVLAVIPYI